MNHCLSQTVRRIFKTTSIIRLLNTLKDVLTFYRILRRYCWVCFATEEDDQTALWVQPCKCRGTTRWVHESCLQRWVDEKQKGNSLERVFCPQCNTEYVIVFPKMGRQYLLSCRFELEAYHPLLFR